VPLELAQQGTISLKEVFDVDCFGQTLLLNQVQTPFLFLIIILMLLLIPLAVLLPYPPVPFFVIDDLLNLLRKVE
jgi:hypothetical protein